MFERITEGKAVVKVPIGKITKKLPVFYNPIMELNRSISVVLLSCLSNKNMQIGLPLAGSGIRGIRFLKELGAGKVKEIWFNDLSENAVKSIKENLDLNKIKGKVKVFNEDGNKFLLDSVGFDYIDIDPFGSPNFLLNNAMLRIARGGVLAVTATDTSALCGTYKDACVRKYWAKPLRNYLMHEIGIRILIRKVQLMGAQFDKALVPIFSHSSDHYMRIYFGCEKGKKRVDDLLKKHGMFMEAGPMWLGNLWDSKLAGKMAKKSDNVLLKIINEESKIDVIGFYDMHEFCKKYKLRIPKKDELFDKIRKKRYKVSATHFSKVGLRSNIKSEELVKIIKEI